MTLENTIRMLIAKEKCIEHEISGCDEMCNNHKCLACELNYTQGNMGEQKECLKTAIAYLQSSDISDDLQSELKYRINEIKELYKENNRLREVFNIKDAERVKLVEENTDLQNQLKQATNERNLLNKQIDKLIAKNNDLMLRRKMFVKTLLNQLYGSCYVVIDSIKETNENDTNN